MDTTAHPLKIERIKAPAAAENKELGAVESVVQGVIAAVRARGDDAVREYSRKFDRYEGQEIGRASCRERV